MARLRVVSPFMASRREDRISGYGRTIRQSDEIVNSLIRYCSARTRMPLTTCNPMIRMIGDRSITPIEGISRLIGASIGSVICTST